ncbi:hypothetical protein KAH55_04720 [bacterium]|nr:hypothetical protein [bacterium]
MKILFLLISMLFITSSAFSLSFYSSKGLGLMAEGYNAQGLALGGAGIIITDNRGLSSINPAALKLDGMARISLSMQMQDISQKNSAGTGKASYVNSHGAHFMVPLSTWGAVTIGLAPMFQADYEFTLKGGNGETEYDDISKGKGSLNKAYASFYYQPIEMLSLGISWKFGFGKYDQMWKVIYYSDYYTDTIDTYRSYYTGNSWDLGFILRPLKYVSIGAVYSMPFKLNVDNQMLYNYSKQTDVNSSEQAGSELQGGNLTLPASWGVGASLHLLDKKLQVLGEYYQQPFSETEFSSSQVPMSYNDYERLSFGVQYVGSEKRFASFWEKIPVRLGYYKKQQHIVYGNSGILNEQALTFGVGLPFYFMSGRVDIGCAIGKRGELSSNPVEENFFNLMVSISGAERWFYRPKK